VRFGTTNSPGKPARKVRLLEIDDDWCNQPIFFDLKGVNGDDASDFNGPVYFSAYGGLKADSGCRRCPHGRFQSGGPLILESRIHGICGGFLSNLSKTAKENRRFPHEFHLFDRRADDTHRASSIEGELVIVTQKFESI
jgi:hypothetical protein